MTEYRVTWEIDIEADTPLEAAEEALTIQRDPESTATFFKVWEQFPDQIRYDIFGRVIGKEHTVDLYCHDQDEDLEEEEL